MALGATLPITFTESGSQLANLSSINSSASQLNVSLSPTNRIANPFAVPASSISLYFQNEPQPLLPSYNLVACLQLAQNRILGYLRTHPDGPLPTGSFENTWDGVYFGVISADGRLLYSEVLATLLGFITKTMQDGYTQIAADILVQGTTRRIGYSVLQWASESTDES